MTFTESIRFIICHISEGGLNHIMMHLFWAPKVLGEKLQR